MLYLVSDTRKLIDRTLAERLHTAYFLLLAYTRAALALLLATHPTALPRAFMALCSQLSTGDLRAEHNALNALHPSARPSPLNAACPRPIPNSYWATPLLLACEYPWAPHAHVPKLDALLAAGVRTFIDLTESGELTPYNPSALAARAALLRIDPATLEYHNFPIQDRSLPESVGYMCRILGALQDNEARGRITAVHCRGGIGRTGMVVGCWLVQSGIARDGDHALQMIAGEWKTVEKVCRYPHSPETGPQFEFVKNFRPQTPLREITCG